MKLSIIIVNYNVKYFLEQCLLSVKTAITHMQAVRPEFDADICVVDNNSVDSSVSMLKGKFPDVRLIENSENKGFSFANNQSIRAGSAEYVLLLNPDTVVEELTLLKIIQFMDEHPDAGALGVKMIDGKGNFLPESKRAFPTPSIAFFKIFGISRLFPKSRLFGKYHLGYLDKDQLHEVDVLAGAFMLIRRSVLDQIGLLDESFFMYGEDIDLSYRIRQAGYKNYYYPDTRIIHYKGESTRKSSVNYVFVFYKAMIIFAAKHLSPNKASLFSALIHLAIWVRAAASVLRRLLIRLTLPVLDALLLYFVLYGIKNFWEQNRYISEGIIYPPDLLYYIIPIYVLLWMAGLWLTGNYRKPYKLMNVGKGIILGTIFISILYAFLDESYRYSRAIILLGAFAAFFAAAILRALLHFARHHNFRFSPELKLAIIGSQSECSRVEGIIRESNLRFSYLGYVSHQENTEKNGAFIGHIGQLDEITQIYGINELVFCAKDVPSSAIIRIMTRLNRTDLIFKIAPEESLFVIGSNNKNEPGDFYTIDISLSISKPASRMNKRFLDVSVAVIALVCSPVLLWFQKNKSGLFRNIIKVLSSRCSWVGYYESSQNEYLPSIKPGILHCIAFSSAIHKLDEKRINDLNMIYARDYTVMNDVRILLKALSRLGNTTPDKP